MRKAMPKSFTDDQLRSLDCPVLALIAGRSVMLDAARAAARARNLLPRGQVELWADASHAINGEYPAEIAEQRVRSGMTWMEHDSTIRRARCVVLAQPARGFVRWVGGGLDEPASFRGPRLGRPLLKCVERHIPVPRHGAVQPDGQQMAANARMVE
jgi:hypothetical protein